MLCNYMFQSAITGLIPGAITLTVVAFFYEENYRVTVACEAWGQQKYIRVQ